MKLTESSPPHSIGVVGLGSMGAPIAAHLAARGFEVRGHDLSAEAMRRAEAHRVIPAQRIDDLTSADVVLLFVPSDEDVLDVGATLTAILRSGAIIGVCSSVRPETCRLLGERAGAQGVAVVDGALTGGVRAAEAGTIRLLAGGDAAVIEALDPLFAAFCSAVAVLGPLGAGQAGKTVNNLLHWSFIAATAEALRFGERLGVPAPRMRSALLDGPTDSRTMRELEHFRLTWWEKDLSNALAMARELGVTLPLAATVRDAMPGITPELLHSFVDDLPMVRPYAHTDVSP